jgi:hypothetical protein
MWVLLMLPRFGGANYASVTPIRLDIAKSVFCAVNCIGWPPVIGL